MRCDRTLLDQIHLVHGPVRLLEKFFQFAEAAVREAGVTLRLRTDFEGLLEINERHRDSWSALMPTFHPGYSRMCIDDAFWIEGVDGGGHPVVTHAGRLFNWDNTTLDAEIRSMRAFFEDPRSHAGAGECIEVRGQGGLAVKGRTMGGGAVWVRPDCRGYGLATLVPKISRAYAITRWNIESNWAVMEPVTREKGLARRNGGLAARSLSSGNFRSLERVR